MLIDRTKKTDGDPGTLQRFQDVLGSSVVRTASFAVFAGLCCSVWMIPNQMAFASCGDYLQHKAVDNLLASGLFDLQSDGHSIPSSRCKNGNCRSQESVPLPTKSPIRVLKDRPDVILMAHQLPMVTLCSLRFPPNELIPLQPAFDVAEPPPRLAV